MKWCILVFDLCAGKLWKTGAKNKCKMHTNLVSASGLEKYQGRVNHSTSSTVVMKCTNMAHQTDSSLPSVNFKLATLAMTSTSSNSLP